jgi:MerR family transcriptional regulator, light-induced transcriptional regulator
MSRAQRVLPLREAADFLGVHYQTAYGWVRQGLLPATKVGRSYQVNVADVHALGAERATGTPPRSEVRVRSWQPQADRFYDALVAGQERLAQSRLERLAAGVPFIELCERLVAPTLRRIGEDWAAGDVTIAVEHRASAICERLIAPLGARQPRGRPRGVAVTATPAGERHGLPALMAAGSLREDHWLVQHLATDLPASEVGRLADDVAARLVVLSAATDEGAQQGAAEAAQLARAYPGLLVLAGRPGESLYDLRELTQMLV